MDRAVTRHSAIEAAWGTIPKQLHWRIRPHFLIGCDPVFVGLHDFKEATYSRSYREIAHCVYPFHQEIVPKNRRHTTVVLTGDEEPEVVVHELGHVLDESLGFSIDSRPVSWYAGTNRAESFAEAFTSWCIPGYAPQDKDTSGMLDWLVSVG